MVERKLNKLEIKVDENASKTDRSRNLLVNGIPYTKYENLNELFKTLSSKLGYEQPPDADVFRFNGTDDNKRPIMMKFPTEFHKKQFFMKYLRVTNTSNRTRRSHSYAVQNRQESSVDDQRKTNLQEENPPRNSSHTSQRGREIRRIFIS